jgi:hypothetical protein
MSLTYTQGTLVRILDDFIHASRRIDYVREDAGQSNVSLIADFCGFDEAGVKEVLDARLRELQPIEVDPGAGYALRHEHCSCWKNAIKAAEDV